MAAETSPGVVGGTVGLGLSAMFAAVNSIIRVYRTHWIEVYRTGFSIHSYEY